MMMASILAAALAAAAPAAQRPLTAPGPLAPLSATLLDAGKNRPVIVIIPGSGPTDRDGNNPLGVSASSYRLLAEALAKRGISTVRIDKRGMFGSKAAIANGNDVTIAAYAADAHAWAKAARAATGAKCVWVLGHSEGSLVALASGQDQADLCGVISVSGMGRKSGDVIREQLRANPANAPILAPALAALDSLEKGQRVDAKTLPALLQQLFADSVQPYLMNLMAQDPARLAGSLKLPLLIVQGDRDLQVKLADANALAAAQPKAKLAILPGVNHVLKIVSNDSPAANFATYSDPSLPIAPGVVDAIAGFVGKR
ncbi:alpha/beta hydrolase [Sphingomonas sp.]|uniref:alpha/beta hydrolase n=1 Tax=Sphingomonas sp. TaxID=28214 RepID=UPI00286C196A|nr:alpha/beta hydrolase [Sphingomonas sp.]